MRRTRSSLPRLRSGTPRDVRTIIAGPWSAAWPSAGALPTGRPLTLPAGPGFRRAHWLSSVFELQASTSRRAMVAVARRREGMPFAVAAAETLPVRDGSIAVVTVGSGLHWFDAARFHAEAVRVLAPGGTLLVYEHAGIAITDDEGFSAWIGQVYLSHYPSPPTPGRFLAAVSAPEGLTKVASEPWEDTVVFSRDELVAYLLTQGNVSNPIDAGEISVEEARQWLLTRDRSILRGIIDTRLLVLGDGRCIRCRRKSGQVAESAITPLSPADLEMPLGGAAPRCDIEALIALCRAASRSVYGSSRRSKVP